jgi:hypothetical protein
LTRGRGRALAAAAAALVAVATGVHAGPPDRPRPTPVPGEPLPYELLGVEQAVLLDGKPFPRRQPYPAAAPEPRRTFYISASGKPGDGTEAKPWGDLQGALSELSAGDRLVVLPGVYGGAFRVDDSCRSGKPRAWIQVVSRKATLRPSAEAPALVVARAYWRFDGLAVSGVEGRGAAPLVELSAGAEHVLFDRARLDAKSGSGLSIRSGARHVTIANSRVTGLEKGAVLEPAIAVDVRGGTSDVTLAADWILDPVGTGIRIGASEAAGAAPAEDVSILGMTVRDSWGPAVLVLSVNGLHIADCDVFQWRMSRVGTGEGLRLESGRKIRVERSHLRGFALAVRVGIGDAEAAISGDGPRDVVVERNYIESQTGRGAAIAVEAGNRIRITNNVLERIAEGFVLFGRPPRTREVLVANNLVLGIGDLAFRIEDFTSVALFDRNVFSPAGELSAEVGPENLSLADLLARGRMPGTRIVPGVRLNNRDLARVEGVKTVDAGWRLAGLAFKGAAPDLGLAEK